MRVLLIVDDETLSLRAIARLLRSQFDEVLTAESAERAEGLLHEHAVTHLLCDRYLTDVRLGEELIKAWRARWSSIRFAALMTGEDIGQLTLPEAIDRVFLKPFDIAELRRSFSS